MAVALAAPHPAGVAAAREVVAAGGSAVDAALAAAAALTVAYPHQCGLGGDLVALVRDRHATVRAVLSIGAAPAAIDVAGLRAAGARMPPGGALSVTVLGMVAGWAALHERGGVLPLPRILAPAVALAQRGVPVSPGLARAVQARLPVVRADPGLAGLLLDRAGVPLPVGGRLRQPALASTLAAVATGWRTFYTGPTAQQLVAALRAGGGPHALADFRAHRAELADPRRCDVDGVRWFAAPPPAPGGTLLAVLAGGGGLAAAHAAEQERDAQLGEPAKGDTAAVSAVGSDGTAVCLIQSVFQSFGAGILEPATGVVLHNRGSAFPLDPHHPGVLRPGARPPHTLCPALATGPGLVAALGSQGGRAQPWILAQLAPAVCDAPELAAVLARPRWVIGARDLGQDRPSLLLEPGLPDAGQLAAVGRSLGRQVIGLPGRHDDAGHVQVARLARGLLAAASDPRADGTAAVIP